jgi:exopolysaccharide biosynthesis polyprenyl glycosylphosphotransferase
MIGHCLIPARVQTPIRLLAVAVDTLLFSAAILLGYMLAGLPEGRWLLDDPLIRQAYAEVYWLPLALAPPVFAFAGLYRRDPYRALVRSMETIFSASLAAVVGTLVLTYAFRAELTRIEAVETGAAEPADLPGLVWGFSLSAMAMTIVFAPLFLLAWRFLANRLEDRLLGYSRVPQTLVVAGRPAPGDAERLGRSYSPCYRVAGYLEGTLTPRDGEALTHAPRLGAVAEAREVLRREGAREMLLLSEQLTRTEFLSLSREAAEMGIRLWVAGDVYCTMLSAVSASLRGRTPVFRIRKTSISGWTLVLKRIIDLVTASVLLLVGVPLFVIPACIAIVIDSKGFPIFAQDRVGQGGRIFRLYKLRTMVVDASEVGPALTADNDPRITRVGQFLRRTSIDELPQLWNVLVGDMSLVGPRAVVPYVADRFADWERVSLNVKPGLTGLAQVSGRDEVGFREKSLLNVYYVRNYSLWLDLRIIFATVLVVLSMEGTGGTRRND